MNIGNSIASIPEAKIHRPALDVHSRQWMGNTLFASDMLSLLVAILISTAVHHLLQKTFAFPHSGIFLLLGSTIAYLFLRDYHVALSACLKAKPDLVYHLADVVAGIDFVFSNEPFLFRSNILINTNTFSAVREAGIGSIIYVGTACSYPRGLQEKPGGTPLLEEQIYPAEPESAYGWSKLMGEYEATLLAADANLQTGILRLHNVYGPRSILSLKRSQVIPSLIRKAIRYPDEEFIVWGTGKQARDFVFVGDVIDALLRLPLKGMCQGPIQIGTAKETTIAELASMIIKISGKRIPIHFDTEKPEGDGGRSGNFERARKILGWDVFTPLEVGLKDTYDWANLQIMDHRVDLVGSKRGVPCE